jgi:predicted enzyme related to lactoylglutathione lyase
VGHESAAVAVREAAMARVTGVGGVFFKSKGDSRALAAWYEKHLGMKLEGFGGVILKWPDDKAQDQGLTVWHVADGDSRWFSPSDSSFMINYRVDDLAALLAQLRADGVEVVGGPESHENGKFAWIMDPDGNKVELWEPMLWDDRNKETPPAAVEP